jgi:hypothetical protein
MPNYYHIIVGLETDMRKSTDRGTNKRTSRALTHFRLANPDPVA